MATNRLFYQFSGNNGILYWVFYYGINSVWEVMKIIGIKIGGVVKIEILIAKPK